MIFGIPCDLIDPSGYAAGYYCTDVNICEAIGGESCSKIANESKVSYQRKTGRAGGDYL